MSERTCEEIIGTEAMYGLEPCHVNLALKVSGEVHGFSDFVSVFEPLVEADVERYERRRTLFRAEPLGEWYSEVVRINKRVEQIGKHMRFVQDIILMESNPNEPSDPRHRVGLVRHGVRNDIKPMCLVYFGIQRWREISAPKTLWLDRIELLRSECIQRQGVERTKKRVDGVVALIHEWDDDVELSTFPLDKCKFTKLFKEDDELTEKREKWKAESQREVERKPLKPLSKQQMAMFEELEVEIEDN